MAAGPDDGQTSSGLHRRRGRVRGGHGGNLAEAPRNPLAPSRAALDNGVVPSSLPQPLDAAQLLAGLDHVRAAPHDDGVVELIVTRPQRGQRVRHDQVELDLAVGVVGDMWSWRPSTDTVDRGAHPDRQVTLISARFATLVGGTEGRILTGDQLFVDLDLSHANLPAGTRLALGTAVIEITPAPHTGCAKFRHRFGPAASELVNTPLGLDLRLRGVNARVVSPGHLAVGDRVHKVVPADPLDQDGVGAAASGAGRVAGAEAAAADVAGAAPGASTAMRRSV